MTIIQTLNTHRPSREQLLMEQAKWTMGKRLVLHVILIPADTQIVT